MPWLSTAQPPSVSHRPRILTAASSHPQGAPVCQPMPMASTRSPLGCQPALPASLSVVMVTRYVVTGEDDASHPSRAVCPARLASPPFPALSPVTPGSQQGTLRGAPAPGSVLGVLHLLRRQDHSCVPGSSCEEWGQCLLLPPALTGHPFLKAQLCTEADKVISVMATCLSSQGETLSLQGQPHLPTAAAAGTAEDEEHATLALGSPTGQLPSRTPVPQNLCTMVTVFTTTIVSQGHPHCVYPAQCVSLLPQNSWTVAQAAHKAASPGLWLLRASSNSQEWAHPQPYQ